MNDAWKQTLIANIISDLDDMLDAGLLTQARYDRAVCYSGSRR